LQDSRDLKNRGNYENLANQGSKKVKKRTMIRWIVGLPRLIITGISEIPYIKVQKNEK
jgi:hypothetical protein